MGLEGFVQAAGSMMGLARDSFGLNVDVGGGLTSTWEPSATLTDAVSGSGQAVLASNSESNAIDAQVSALGAQNLAANAHLDGTLTAAGAGRGQMEAVIEAALADISSLAATTTSLTGQLALVQALVARLEQTSQALTNGQADASTRTASSGQLAAAYNGLGNGPLGSLAQMPPTTMAASPMGAMSSMPMLAAASMAANAAALSSSQAANTQQSGSGVQLVSAVQPQNPDQGEINTVLGRARHYIGTPYSYGGGTPSGPTLGIDQGAHTKGFDCSSFVQMAYWPYVHLPRTSELQANVGTSVSFADIRPGDLIFSEPGESGPGAGHVQMAVGYGKSSQVIAAEHTGTNIGIGGMDPTAYLVKRLLGGAGGSAASKGSGAVAT
jgi:cell wall-associated NlpC family hydrolase